MANDHYVPQFYLRGFQAAPGKIWLYERGKQPRLRGIRSVASEDNYYTLKTNMAGVEKDKLDKIFQDLESGAAPILQHLKTASTIDLCPDDRELLSMFIATLSNRIPYQKERLMNLHSSSQKELLKLFAGNKETYYEYARDEGLTDPEEIEKSRLLAFDDSISLEYEPNSASDYFLGQALELAELITPFILQKHWHLLESKTSRVFVTSDNPVVLMPGESHNPRMGIGIENGLIAMPVSPTRSLFLSNRQARSALIRISREAVIGVNQWTILRAHTQVFANLKSEDIKTAFNNTTQGHNTKVVVTGGLTKEDFEGRKSDFEGRKSKPPGP